MFEDISETTNPRLIGPAVILEEALRIVGKHSGDEWVAEQVTHAILEAAMKYDIYPIFRDAADYGHLSTFVEGDVVSPAWLEFAERREVKGPYALVPPGDDATHFEIFIDVPRASSFASLEAIEDIAGDVFDTLDGAMARVRSVFPDAVTVEWDSLGRNGLNWELFLRFAHCEGGEIIGEVFCGTVESPC